MAEERKIGTLIEITYQATKAKSGLTDVIMEIYDETRAKDIGTFPDVVMAEIGTTGRYYGSFTSNAEGIWRIMIDSATKPGKMVKDFKIVGHDVDSVGDAILIADGKIDTVDGKVDTAIAGVATVDGKADGIKTKTDLLPVDPAGISDVAQYASSIQGTDGDTLKDISDQIDVIPGFEAPPMIG